MFSSVRSDDEEALDREARAARLDVLLQDVGEELKSLRKTVLRQGHAQELFQARVEEAVGRLGTAPPPQPSGLGSAQVRVLLELDQAVLQLLRLAEEDASRPLREGLSFLQIRVRNLQHSMGLEAIPARNLPFDDRWHEACGVVHRPDLPDGRVVEEILPGYRLGGRLVRPARVVVNSIPEEIQTDP